MKPLQITHVSISNKHRLKVMFVKDGKVINSNTVSFSNQWAAKRFLVNPLTTLFG